MSQNRAVLFAVGDTFGRLEDDDFLVTGTITRVTDLSIDVDFGDWVQRYPIASLSVGYHYFQRLVGAGEEQGKLVMDYRLGMAA